LLPGPQVATQPSEKGAVCHDWEALKRAVQEGQAVTYEFNGKELHVWRGEPRVGEACQCGRRIWK
jgi:hypothetical protein